MEIPKSSLHLLAHFLIRGDLRFVLEKLSHRLYSTTQAFGLRRDLAKSFEKPDAKIPITIQKAGSNHVSELLELNSNASSESLWERYRRIRLYQFGLQTSYVGLTDESRPCYIQWLVSHTEKEKIRAFFGAEFPELKKSETLLEGAFIPENFRSYRIMPCAMAMVAEKGGDIHARFAITFVAADNIPSLKGCVRSGFTPYICREERWRFFRHAFKFRPFSASDNFPIPYPQAEKAI